MRPAAFIRTNEKAAPGAGDGAGRRLLESLLLLWAVTHPGRAQRLRPGGSRRRGPQAQLRDVPGGRSPPAEAAHRPDPATQEPGGVDVWGWEGKARMSRESPRGPSVLRAVPSAPAWWVALPTGALTSLPPGPPGHAGTCPQRTGTQRVWRGHFWEVSSSSHQDQGPLPFLPPILVPGVGTACLGPGPPWWWEVNPQMCARQGPWEAGDRATVG